MFQFGYLCTEQYIFVYSLDFGSVSSDMYARSSMSIPLSSPQCENLHLEKAVFASTTLNPSSVLCHPSSIIPRNAYSFLAKLAASDLNSALRLSDTRPFPPRRTLFLKLSRNNHPRWGFHEIQVLPR